MKWFGKSKKKGEDENLSLDNAVTQEDADLQEILSDESLLELSPEEENALKKAEIAQDAKVAAEPAATETPSEIKAEAKEASEEPEILPEKKKKKLSKGIKVAIILLIFVAFLFGGVSGFAYYITKTDTVLPNVSVEGVNVSGLSYDEAKEKLKIQGLDKIDHDSVINVKLPLEKELDITALQASANLTSESAATAAFSYGHKGNIYSNLMDYIKAKISPVNLVTDLSPSRTKLENILKPVLDELEKKLTENGMDISEKQIMIIKGAKSADFDRKLILDTLYDRFKNRDYGEYKYVPKIEGEAELNLDEIHASIYAEVKDAYYDKNTREVVKSVVGVDFDKDKALKLWNAAASGETITIDIVRTEPKVTTEEIEKSFYRDVLGTATTTLLGSSSNRINNVKLACAALNNKILYPGEQFSYNAALGKRTQERGYKYAGAYSGGEVVQEVGGGICQVSSSLYYTSLLSNLEINDRTCHHFSVAYLPPGMDATVSWGKPDFKFTNNRNFPIKIEATVNEEEKNMTINILGTNEDGTYVKVTFGTWLIYTDEEYPEVATGFKAATFRNIYDKDDKLISKTREANSTYYYHKEDIKYPEPSPSPTEAPPHPTAAPEPTVAPPTTEPEAPPEP